MGHPQFQIQPETPLSALLEIQRRVNELFLKFSMPETRPSVPLPGSVRWDDTGGAAEVYQESTASWLTLATSNADFKVKVSSDDTTGNYLLAKLAAGNAISLTETNPGGDEDVTVAVVEADIDHGTIGGLGDDDHTQYSLVNGTRAYTGVVGGIYPTDDSHLSTYQSVEDMAFRSSLLLGGM